MPNGGYGCDDISIEGIFNTATQVRFFRYGTERPINGHYFVFEALNVSGSYAFSVQPRTFSFSASSGTTSITSVVSGDTLLVGSYRTNAASDHADDGALRLFLTNCSGIPLSCDQIQAERYTGTATTTVTAYAITFNGGARIQRGTFTYPASGGGAGHESSGDQMFMAQQLLRLTDPTTVQGNRAAASTVEAVGTWEAIEFQLAFTAVELVSFEAVAADGAVELSWETGSELDNLGFRLYRSLAPDGPWLPVTDALIPGLGSSPVGASYTYRDTGLENGVEVHYLLEDVEITGLTETHGPVAATPTAGAGAGAASEAEPGDAAAAGSAAIRYGDPEASSLSLSEIPGGLILELRTGGFYADVREDGGVALRVPGWDLLDEPGLPELPVKRRWVDAIAGRRARLGRVEVLEQESVAGLRPADTGAPQLVVDADGTLRPGQRRARPARPRGSLYPEQPARLLEVGFQGEDKKALLELAPLRHDLDTGGLVLARRLRVRISFAGAEVAERPLGGARGRRRAVAAETSGAAGAVVARLATREAGVYVVTFDELFPGRRRPVRVSELRLSHQGEAVAFHVEPDGGRFGRGPVLYFLSAGASGNPWGREAVYELEEGVAGLGMELADASPVGPGVEALWARGEWQQVRFYQPTLLDAPDIWLWDRVFGGQVWGTDFELSGVAGTGGPGRLQLWLQGGSDLEAYPDHHVRVRVNGAPVAEGRWDGLQPLALEGELAPGVLHDGINRLEVENAGDTGAAYSVVYVDRFAIRYARHPVPAAGVVEGVSDRSGRVHAAGLGPGTLLLETGGAAPRWLVGAQAAGGAVDFRVQAGGRYLAVDPAAVRRPEVRVGAPARLRESTNRADYLVVGPRAFVAEAGPLLALRRHQGLEPMAVALEDVFDEFGHGESRPEALRAFLAHAYHAWSGPTLRYVVLLGDASLDPQDLLGTGVPNHVPAPLLRSSYLWTAGDPLYAAVNGEDDLPDLALGRLPASSAEEARALVEKVVAWEENVAGLADPVVLVADDPDPAGNFEADAEQVAQTLLGGHEIERLYLSRLGGATRDAFDRGAGLVSYLGHGALSMWASENILNSSQVAALQPQPRQPLVLTMNCMNGYFTPPATDSLSERLVTAQGKGAIAAFSPSGMSVHASARRYHEALVRELVSGGHRRLGDAILAAQLAYAETGALPELLALYHLFGDPGLSLR